MFDPLFYLPARSLCFTSSCFTCRVAADLRRGGGGVGAELRRGDVGLATRRGGRVARARVPRRTGGDAAIASLIPASGGLRTGGIYRPLRRNRGTRSSRRPGLRLRRT